MSTYTGTIPLKFNCVNTPCDGQWEQDMTFEDGQPVTIPQCPKCNYPGGTTMDLKMSSEPRAYLQLYGINGGAE